MKPIIHYFTYSGESEILPVSIAFTRLAYPGNPIHIVDDSASPLSPVQIARCGDVHYSQSSWDRLGNLNGPACIRGILDTMHNNVAQYCAPYAIKIDSDTLILNNKRYLSWLKRGMGHFTQTTPDRFFGGMYYALRADILTVCCQNARQMELPSGCKEDNTIGCLANIASHTGLWIVEDGRNPNGEGRIGGYNYGFMAKNGGVDMDYIDKVIDHLDVVNIGTHHKHKLPLWARNLVANAFWQRYQERYREGSLPLLQMEQPATVDSFSDQIAEAGIISDSSY